MEKLNCHFALLQMGKIADSTTEEKGGGMEGKTSLNPDDKMVLKRRGKEKEDEEKEGKGSRLKCVAQRQIAEG